MSTEIVDLGLLILSMMGHWKMLFLEELVDSDRGSNQRINTREQLRIKTLTWIRSQRTQTGMSKSSLGKKTGLSKSISGMELKKMAISVIELKMEEISENSSYHRLKTGP